MALAYSFNYWNSTLDEVSQSKAYFIYITKNRFVKCLLFVRREFA